MYELRLFRLLSVMLLLGSLFLFKKNQKMAEGKELGSKSIIYTQWKSKVAQETKPKIELEFIKALDNG